MKSLYMPQYQASICWHQVGQGGDSVVFLPGMGFPASGNFSPVINHADMGGKTGLLIDFFGTGDSDAVPGFPATIEAHAECVAAIMDHVKCGPCPVVGYSFGGAVAAMLATKRPDLVSRLIIAEGNLMSGGGAASRLFASFSEDAFAKTEFAGILEKLRGGASDFEAFIAKAYAHIDPRILHAMARALVDIPEGLMTSFLALDIPRTYMYGEKNDPRITGITSPDIPDPQLLLQGGCRVECLKNVGHELMLGNLDGFVNILRRAL